VPSLILPVARLIVFQALAVNAGSTLSPIGNPQNIFLWQSSGLSFIEFCALMAPLGVALTLLLLLLIPVAFKRQQLSVHEAFTLPSHSRKLLWTALLLYPVFLLAVDLGHAVAASLALLLLFAIAARRVVLHLDWLLLLLFVMMFIDLGLLAQLPTMATWGSKIDALPGTSFLAGAMASQLMSNVPASIFLYDLSADWARLAWGVSVGGFGLAIGSMANLIALRLGRQPGIWLDFHRWALPMFLLSLLAGAALLPLATTP
jgi:Na+/H+ antiporter NhaD/arsenite permease-like protein